jgi:CubicO group peptidase (beta-lactamase class C family)
LALPDTPVGRQVAWLLASVGPDGCTEDDVRTHFAQSFLDKASVTLVLSIMGREGWMASAEVSVEELSEVALRASLSVAGEVRGTLEARVETDVPHRFDALLIRPPGPTLLRTIDRATALDGPLDVVVKERFGAVAEKLAAGGVVLGMSRSGQRDVFSFGADPALRYEIGSITKTFTGLLLAEMASRGEVREDDRVRVHLPDGVSVPCWEDRELTLVDLATQSSGLPRLPPNMDEGQDPQDPYAHIDADRRYTALAATTLEYAPGTKTLYSNFGFGLLGHALSLAGGRPFADLVVERICVPLGMARTSFSSGSDDVAQGYNGGEPVKHWTGEVTQGAGVGLESTIDDMLTYAEANADPSSTPIADALNAVHRVHIQEQPRTKQAFGWLHIQLRDGSDVLFHNGGTAGFSSSLVAHQPTKTCVVALCNGGGGADLDRPVFGLLASLIANVSSGSRMSQ